MIVTVTVNAALDRTLTVPVFQIGFRHRSSDVLTLAGGNVFLLLLLIAILAFVLGIGLPTVSVYILTATLLAPALVKLGVATSDAVAPGTPSLARPDAERFDETFERVRALARERLPAAWVSQAPGGLGA